MKTFTFTIAHRRDKAPTQVVSVEGDSLMIARLDAVKKYAIANGLPPYKVGTRQSVYFAQFDVRDGGA